MVPGLFLGSIGAAQNEARLIELGITHVLCVGRDIAPPSNLNQRVISIQVPITDICASLSLAVALTLLLLTVAEPPTLYPLPP